MADGDGFKKEGVSTEFRVYNINCVVKPASEQKSLFLFSFWRPRLILKPRM